MSASQTDENILTHFQQTFVGAGVLDGPKRFWNSMFQNRSCSGNFGDAENLSIEAKFSVGLGRLRAPPVADTASNKEWQNQGDWRVCFAHDDRAADSTVREASPYAACPTTPKAPTSVGRDHRARRFFQSCAERTHHLFTIHFSLFTVLCSPVTVT